MAPREDRLAPGQLEHRPVQAAVAHRGAAVHRLAVQLHGAYGFSDEYDVERYLRNAKGAVIYEGSSEIQRLVIARHILGLH